MLDVVEVLAEVVEAGDVVEVEVVGVEVEAGEVDEPDERESVR